MSSSTTTGDPVSHEAVLKTNGLTEAPSTTPSTTQSTDAGDPPRRPPVSTSQFEESLINEMKDFDKLLRMLSVYRDNPDLRGNPDDRNIEEIAKVLSGFIGDDVDSFLSDEEEAGPDDKSDTQEPNDHNSIGNHNNE